MQAVKIGFGTGARRLGTFRGAFHNYYYTHLMMVVLPQSWITESLNERSMELEALPEDPPPVIIDPQPQEAWEAPEQAAPATPVKTPPKVRKGKAKATAAAASTPLRRSARNAAPETESKPARIPSPPPTPAVAKPIIAFGMPNPNSAEWEETPMYVPTVPRGEPATPKPKTRKKALA